MTKLYVEKEQTEFTERGKGEKEKFVKGLEIQHTTRSKAEDTGAHAVLFNNLATIPKTKRHNFRKYS